MFALGTGPASLPVMMRAASGLAPLSALTLPGAVASEASAAGALVGTIGGVTQGSMLTLVDDAAGRFALSGSDLVRGAVGLDFETAASHSVTIRETLEGAPNSPRDSVVTIAVTNIFEQPALGALTLSPATATVGTAATIAILGTTPGSVLTGTVPPGLALNSPARTITGTPTTQDGSAAWSITETLGDSPNSPRTSSGTIAVAPAVQPPVALAAPIVTGDTAIGSVLTATTGSWGNAPTAYAYQWLRAGVPIAGASAASYTLTLADGGKAVSVEVTASNAGGSTKSAPAAGIVAAGTRADRYSFASTKFRLPTTNLALATGTYSSGCSQSVTYSPDYPVTDPRFLFPQFWVAASSETMMSGGTLTIRSVLVTVNDGTSWTEIPGAAFAGMAVLDGSAPGWLSPAFTGLTIPANSRVGIRVYYTISNATMAIPTGLGPSASIGIATGAGPTYERRAGITVANDGATGLAWTNRASGALTAVPTGTTNGTAPWYVPVAMLAKGGDGRPAFLGLGPSGTMFGADDSTSATTWSPRGAIGAVERGFDDKTSIDPVSGQATKRIPICIYAVSGSAYTTGTNNAASAVNTAQNTNKWALLQLVKDSLGEWPFDKLVIEPYLNGIPANDAAALSALTAIFTDLKAKWGKPIVVNEGTNLITYNAAGTPIPGALFAYPSGVVWASIRQRISKISDSDPTAYFRTANPSFSIEESFAQYRGTVADFAAANINVARRPSGFTTTLTGALTTNQAIWSLAAAPTAGMVLEYVATDGTRASALCTSVNGTTYNFGAGAKPVASGATVTEAYSLGGTHPGPQAHLQQVGEVLKYKARAGLV